MKVIIPLPNGKKGKSKCSEEFVKSFLYLARKDFESSEHCKKLAASLNSDARGSKDKKEELPPVPTYRKPLFKPKHVVNNRSEFSPDDSMEEEQFETPNKSAAKSHNEDFEFDDAEILAGDLFDEVQYKDESSRQEESVTPHGGDSSNDRKMTAEDFDEEMNFISHSTPKPTGIMQRPTQPEPAKSFTPAPGQNACLRKVNTGVCNDRSCKYDHDPASIRARLITAMAQLAQRKAELDGGSDSAGQKEKSPDIRFPNRPPKKPGGRISKGKLLLIASCPITNDTFTDLDHVFVKEYGHVKILNPDAMTLVNEDFWRDYPQLFGN